MKLKEILNEPIELSWRILLSKKNAAKLGDKEIFAGSCKWDGKTLISLDGDSYSLEDEIVGFLKMRDHMIYWTKEDELPSEEM